MSRSVLFSAVLILGLCCTSLGLHPKSGDPALDGKDYLISEADFRAILTAARTWLTKTHPSFSVRRVHVITRDKVEVYVRGRLAAHYGAEEDMHFMELQRAKKYWRIAGDNLDAMPTID